MKKVFGYLGWILFGITFIALVYFIYPKNSTCDFRGYIEEIQADEQNKCTWITISEVTNKDSYIKLKITDKTPVKNLDGKTISTDRIQIGQMLDGDTKGDKIDDAYYQAKWIKIYS